MNVIQLFSKERASRRQMDELDVQLQEVRRMVAQGDYKIARVLLMGAVWITLEMEEARA